ncbi:MAG: NFACT family protein, partial [Oscillospiraceae bacterium]|nr:NFACT family protein [Oscillospiraceae bacterium]
MPFDAVTVGAVKNELYDTVVGARIDKVQQPARDLLVLSLRGRGQGCRLLISAGTGTARLHLMKAAYENPRTPPMFCMLLRKHLIGARVAALEQPGMDRMLIFELDCFDEMGVPIKKRLIAELMGRNANVILAGPDGRVIDALRRVDGDMSRIRQVMPGLIYRFPPAQGRPGFFALSGEERRALLRSADPELSAEKWLIDSFSGLSPLLCRELAFRACGDAAGRLGRFTPEQAGAFRGAMDALAEAVGAAAFEPTMLLVGGEPSDFSFMPIKQYGRLAESVSYADFSGLLEDFYTRRDRQEQMRRKSQALYRQVKNAHERSVRKLAARREELRLTEDR